MADVAEGFPVIDFSTFETNKALVADEIFQAASKWGFLVLKGHGIPSEDIKKMFSTVCFCNANVLSLLDAYIWNSQKLSSSNQRR